MFDSLSVPVVFAHRGASAYAPENTMPAIELAASQGVEAIEIDVQLAADDSVVVFHDLSIARTTNGTGHINQLTFEQLKSLHAGAGFGSAYPDAKIPTLGEVLRDSDPHIFINIELKNFHTPFDSLPFRAAKIVREFRAENRVMFSSFNPVALSRVRSQLPEVPRGLLLHKPFHLDLLLLFPRLLSGFQSVNMSFSCVTVKRVEALHEHGKKVFAYTLNHPDDIRSSLQSGVDGFFTDDPALGLRTLIENGYNSN